MLDSCISIHNADGDGPLDLSQFFGHDFFDLPDDFYDDTGGEDEPDHPLAVLARDRAMEQRHADAKAFRHGAWANGFVPLLVYSHDRLSDPVGKRGKRPVGNDWPVRFYENPPEAVRLEPHDDCLNTGIICRGLRAIDIDIKREGQEEQADAVYQLALEMLGTNAPLRTRDGSSSRLMLFRAAEGEPRKLDVTGLDGMKIEILGAGQQFVSHGTHESGAALEWSNGSPLTVRRSELPVVTEEQCAEFLKRAAPMIGADQVDLERKIADAERLKQAEADYVPSCLRDRDPLTANDVRSIIKLLPADTGYDDWFIVVSAIRSALPGDPEALDIADEYSRKSPSYHRKGLEDKWRALRGRGSNGAGVLINRVMQIDPNWRSEAAQRAAQGVPVEVYKRLNDLTLATERRNEQRRAGTLVERHYPEDDPLEAPDSPGDELEPDVAEGAPEGAEQAAEAVDEAVAEPVTVCLPAGFAMETHGLIQTTFKKIHEGGQVSYEPVYTRLTQRFDLIGEVWNEQSREPGVLIGWADATGTRHEHVVSAEDIVGPTADLMRSLARAGFKIHEINAGGYQGIKEFFNGLENLPRMTSYASAGWQGDQLFLLPNGAAIGPKANSSYFRARRPHIYAASGTVEDWRDKVATLALGNSRLAFALSLAFAGPLIRLTGTTHLGFHLFANSSSGKTSAAYMCGSVWGRPDGQDQIRSWRTTDNGLEGIAAETSHSILILDEIGQADGRKISDMIYMVANGTSKSRSTVTGESRATRSWTSSLLSTGEMTAEDVQQGAGAGATTAGVDIRLINVAADAGKAMGLFEQLHEVTTPGAFADLIRDRAMEFHGTAARAFLSKLMSFSEADRRQVHKRVEAITNDLARDLNDGGQARRVASKFAVVAIAGETAITFGILPWPAGTAEAACRGLFAEWLKMRGGSKPKEETLLFRRVCSFLEQHGESRFTGGMKDKDADTDYPRAIINKAGWYAASKFGGGDFYVYSETFKDIAAPLSPVTASKLLSKAGYLRSGVDGKASTQKRHDGVMCRVYCISEDILAAER